ncbi:MAG: L-lactate dehydrogenase [Turicibacter sp.]|nr:L-lactate dehydrogenase [Turicibacter sp.]
MRRVGIIGTGLVGATCGYALITQNVCQEILLIDINQERAQGEMLDLMNSVQFMSQRTKVRVASYEDCKDVDIIIFTAGAVPKKGQTRLDTLGVSAVICESVVKDVMASGFNGFFVVASNPVDIISYHIWKLSGLPKNKVIGTGTSIDTARLKDILAPSINVNPNQILAYVLGEHGDSQIIPWSVVTVGGIPLLNYIKESLDLDDIARKTAQVGWEIYKQKGTTYYGIAAAVVGIIKAIFYDEQIIMPTSAMLEGEYEEFNIYTGVPTIIGKNGVESVLEIPLTQDELNAFKHSNNVLREYMKTIGE